MWKLSMKMSRMSKTNFSLQQSSFQPNNKRIKLDEAYFDERTNEIIAEIKYGAFIKDIDEQFNSLEPKY
jgi:hypothetical protein